MRMQRACGKGIEKSLLNMGATIETIYQNFDSQLANFICRMVNHQDCCHDILQEVYCKVIVNIDKIEKADNLKSYLLKVADNAVVDYYRKKVNKQNEVFSEELAFTKDTPVNDLSLQLADCCL